MVEQRTAILITRVWWETGADQPLRARFIAADVEHGATDVGLAANVQDALTKFGEWLTTFVRLVD
jgi:hypothetical protein